jgi:hypothetical protein
MHACMYTRKWYKMGGTEESFGDNFLVWAGELG